MSLTKEFLSDLGVDAEKIEQIINEHNKAIDEKSTENNELRTQFEDFKNKISAKETAEKKSGALRKFLKEKKYSETGIDKIVKYGGYLDGIELDDNGNIQDSEKLVTSIEKDWGEYKPSETTTYTTPSTPPKSTSNIGTKSEVSQYAEAYYNRLYGAKKED